MRGARIAEKIQEYYHSNSNIVQPTVSHQGSSFVPAPNQNSKHSSLYNQNQVSKSEGPKTMKQFVNYNQNPKQLKNSKG
jgi:hypothetical protein